MHIKSPFWTRLHTDSFHCCLSHCVRVSFFSIVNIVFSSYLYIQLLLLHLVGPHFYSPSFHIITFIAFWWRYILGSNGGDFMVKWQLSGLIDISKRMRHTGFGYNTYLKTWARTFSFSCFLKFVSTSVCRLFFFTPLMWVFLTSFHLSQFVFLLKRPSHSIEFWYLYL